MLSAVLLSIALQSGQAASPANTIPSPNSSDRWPGAGTSDYRWRMSAPSGYAPFAVVTSTEGQIAIRRVTTEVQGGSYYVAVRQTPERLEQADSRECQFGEVVLALRNLPVPEIVVPGSRPPQGLVGSAPIHAAFERVTVFGSRQPSGQRADLTIAAADGPVNDWIGSLRAATQSCWKPMAPPDPA